MIQKSLSFVKWPRKQADYKERPTRSTAEYTPTCSLLGLDNWGECLRSTWKTSHRNDDIEKKQGKNIIHIYSILIESRKTTPFICLERMWKLCNKKVNYMHPGGMVQSPKIQNLLKWTLMNYEANPSISMDTISQERIHRLHLIHNKKLITNNLRAMKAKMLFGNMSLHNMTVLVKIINTKPPTPLP